MELITSTTILTYIKECVQNKVALDPDVWLDGAAKLNIFLSDEFDKLAESKQKVAIIKLSFLEGSEKKNVSEARLRTEATEEYKEMKKLESRCGIIEEYIRIAKLMARKEGNF